MQLGEHNYCSSGGDWVIFFNNTFFSLKKDILKKNLHRSYARAGYM